MIEQEILSFATVLVVAIVIVLFALWLMIPAFH